jgi:peptide/nickel transport system permease protein
VSGKQRKTSKTFRRAKKNFLMLWNNIPGRIGLVILIAICIIAIFADFISPFNPFDINQRDSRLLPPSPKHLLGTDGSGIDILSQIFYGFRVSLIVGLLAALIVSAIGTIIGVIAGYSSKIVDSVLMRAADVVLVLPGIPIMVVFVVYLGTSFWNIIIIFTILGWAAVARVVRAQTLSIKEYSYVEASRCMGAGQLHIIIKHIIPNILPVVMINAVIIASGAILAEAGLSYIGFVDKSVYSLGRILSEAQLGSALFLKAWWWIIFPGVAIIFIIAALILLGYALDEILNPRLRKY